MAEHIGLEAIFGTEAFERGINTFMSKLAEAVSATQSGGPAMGQAVSQGVDQMAAGTDRMAASMGQAGGGVDVFSQIAIGALRKIGEAAIQYLGQAISAIGEFATGSLQYAMEAETSLARVEAVLAAQGDQADMTGQDAADLAMQYRDLAGGSDEAVLGIIDMALRMGNISRNQMPRFIQTVVDLAAVTGRDYPDAARMMAQAQLDATSAIRLFRSAGLAFTVEQREQITALQRSGDEAGAFAIVMDRVSAATQGAAGRMADTTAGNLAIVQGHWEELREDLMRPFLPALAGILEALAPAIDAFSRILTPASEGLAAFSTAFGDAFGAVIDLLLGPQGVTEALDEVEVGTANALAGLTGAAGTPVPGMAGINFAGLGAAGEQAFWSPERGWFTEMEAASTAVERFTMDIEGVPTADPFQTLSDSLARLGIDIAPLAGLWYGVGQAWQDAQGTIGATIQPLLNLFGQIGAWWDTYGPGLMATAQETFAGFAVDVGNLAEAIRPFVQDVLQRLSDWWATNGPLVAEAMQVMQERSAAIFGWLGDTLPGIWAVIEPILGGLLDALLGIGTGMLQIITGDWAGAGASLSGAVQAALDGVQAAIEAAFLALANWVAGWFGTTWGGIVAQWQANWDMFGIILPEVWARITAAITAGLTAAVSGIQGLVANFIGAGANLIGGLVQGIVGAAQGVVNAVVNAVRAAWQAAMDFLDAGSPSQLFADMGEQTMAGMAQGILGAMAGPRRAIEVATAYTAAPGQAASQQVSAPALMGGGGDTNYYDSHDQRTNNVAIHGQDLSNPFVIKRLFDQMLQGG